MKYLFLIVLLGCTVTKSKDENIDGGEVELKLKCPRCAVFSTDEFSDFSGGCKVRLERKDNKYVDTYK